MKRTPKNVAVHLCIDEERAAVVIGLMDGSLDPYDYESVRGWVAQCYNEPSDTELRMCAIDGVLETCGVEAVRREGSWVDSYHGDIIATYCNTGDMYSCTVVRDHRDSRFKIMCIGDLK